MKKITSLPKIKTLEEILMEKVESRSVTLTQYSYYEDSLKMMDFVNVFEGINYIIGDIKEIHSLEARRKDMISYSLTFYYGAKKYQIGILSESLKDCFGDLKTEFESELLFRIVDALKYGGYNF